MLHEQVRGQLETNMARVCPDNAHPQRCLLGQCIHHFLTDCGGHGDECVCIANPNGQQDCVIYDSLAGGVQTGPNIFTTLSALRYAGASGNLSWLAARMPLLRSMIDFLEPLYDSDVGLFLVPGSLQIDVFVRANFTSDSNAMFIILFELFADAEAAVGNATGAAACMARAAALRAGLNTYLMSPDGDHYCTQSDKRADGSVAICARDFVDYDANAIAIAARVPPTAAAANKIFARMDGGKCTHAGRATYVSEKFYDKDNCVGGNTGDSAVAMGRIGWQDALARQAVGDAAAQDVFTNVLLGPLQRDALSRTWLPERFNCDVSFRRPDPRSSRRRRLLSPLPHPASVLFSPTPCALSGDGCPQPVLFRVPRRGQLDSLRGQVRHQHADDQGARQPADPAGRRV